ncbi:hypothetical protein NP493_4363g00008 [Ridgeia piscesae]|uniref:Uncharacterized protein n=1 Tax=Ridgeia piscesae TaxID=27915 RepID=A0AAD9MU48_RIDPI|nr:hypothetical protein NP493_4363g00008 [Ridgeia piscesae]
MPQGWLSRKLFILFNFFTLGNNPILIQGEVEYLMSSNQPLAPFGSEDVIDSSVTHSLPDMFPVAPTIDLKHQHIWRDTNITGWREGFSHPHPHTLYLTCSDFWSVSQRNARGLAFCFAHALALAHSKYGVSTTFNNPNDASNFVKNPMEHLS